MPDDVSVFDSRLRRHALIALVAGTLLAVLAGIVGDAGTPQGPPWPYMSVYAIGAAAFLYARFYRNLQKRVAAEEAGGEDAPATED